MKNISRMCHMQGETREDVVATRRSKTRINRNPMASFTAFMLYLGLIIIPNPMWFNIRVVGSFALTPVRCILLILVYLLMIDLTLGKRKTKPSKIYSELLLPASALLVFKVLSLLYSKNVSFGMQVIEWHLEAVLISFIYFYYYRNGTIQSRKTAFCLFTGFVISLFVSMLQISNSIYQLNLFPVMTDYLLKVSAPAEVARSRISGLALA